MKFGIYCLSEYFDIWWYICIDERVPTDMEFIELLGRDEYLKTMELFGATIGVNGELKFTAEKQAKECAKYFNDKYLVMLKLSGKM